jgi:hypothetical protein
MTPGEEPSPKSISFSLCALSHHLVVGFLRGIVPAIKNKSSETKYRETPDKNI